jgi:hypothetical protein
MSSSQTKINGDRANALITPDIPDVACATNGNIALTGEQTINGVTTSASRVLVWKQTTASQNGVYVSAAGAWARATDFATTGQFVPKLFHIAAADTLYGDLYASYKGPANPVVGTDAINFSVSYSAPTFDKFVGGTGGTDTTGTYAVPVGHYRKIIMRAWGSGGAAGSGRKSASGVVACAGGPGGGGGFSYAEYDYAQFVAAHGFSLTYIAGGSTAGGAGQATDSTNGSPGIDGKDSSITAPSGRLLLASGGTGGLGGTTALGTKGGGGTGMWNGTAGTDASTTGLTGSAGVVGAFNGLSAMAATGGGAGGGVSAANAGGNGALGGGQQPGAVSTVGGAAIGTANGVDATAATSLFSLMAGGIGGPGGGGGQTTRGTDGAKGMLPGGGGGSGGGARDGQSRSGAGGASGEGVVTFECV